MLVYLDNNQLSQLMEEKENYPHWIIEEYNNRVEEEEQKKAKKQTVSDIPLLNFDKDLKGKRSETIGFVPKDFT
jgi:hypothetical protein